MSSCLNGGERTYRLKSLDLEIIKSPSSTSWISNSSSPSSALSESSNSHLAISTRKPRTPRKRPNQTYNEAAAILSTAYPKIFLTKPPCKFTKSHYHNKNHYPLLFETSDLLVSFQEVDDPGFLMDPSLLQRPPTNYPVIVPKRFNPCQSSGEINSSEICHDCREEDLDVESMLDEEIGEGIESIIGNLIMENESMEDPSTNYNSSTQMNNFCYGYPVGLGLEFGYGMRRQLRAMRNGDEYDWWRFRSVNVLDVTRKIAKTQSEKKKKNKVEKELENTNSISTPKPNNENLALKGQADESVPQPNAGLHLKLNYDSILNAWSDKGSPFSGDSPVSDSIGNDIQGRFV